MTLSTKLIADSGSMAGGTAAVAGSGEQHDFTIGGTWAAGDTISLIFTDNYTGLQSLAGAGNITGQVPNFVFTFNDKLYVLAGEKVFFSAVEGPTDFNGLDSVGNGFVQLSNKFIIPENPTAVAAYQGRLVFFSRQGMQIWTTPADPSAWQLNQVLELIGTRSPFSVRSSGDLEVFFLDETGIRSLRAKETTLNAFPEDLGSPIDSLVQAKLVASSDAQKDAACGIVEPTSKRYWLFLKDTIYVFSTFPTSKIAAWSKYLATYSSGGVQTAFTPSRFVVFKGMVYARDTTALYLFGGTDNNTFDNAVATAELPWLDGKTPSTRKSSKGVDILIRNGWTLTAGMDPESGTLVQIFTGTTPSFDKGKIPYSDQGTHFKLKAVTTGSVAAILAALTFKYDLGDEE